MVSDIFHIDWILVDSIIIILLLILLITVKIFRKANRWRSSLCNENLFRFMFKGSSIKIDNEFILLKKFELTKQIIENHGSNSKSSVIILKSKGKRKFISALAEGISSYGMDVINLKCKVLKKPNQETIKFETQKEIIKLIKSLFDFFDKNKIQLNTKYYLINFIDDNLMYKAFYNDINSKKLILINPKLNKFNKTQINEISKYINRGPQLCLIFSGKISLFLKKLSLNRFIQEFISNNKSNGELFVFEKASNSFKNYETILLGTLITIIEKV